MFKDPILEGPMPKKVKEGLEPVYRNENNSDSPTKKEKNIDVMDYEKKPPR